MHCRTQCPHPAAGHHQPMPPPETSGHSWACLGQSLVGSLLLSPGPWGTQGSICALPESVSPVLCKFWWLCGGLNCDLLQEGLCQTQVYCTQSPCPHSSPLLTHTSARDSWALTGKSGSVSCGVTASLSWVLVHTRFCLWPPRVCFPSPV